MAHTAVRESSFLETISSTAELSITEGRARVELHQITGKGEM